MVLANTGCDRNNSDLQSAGTLILLPGLYRAYERERSVKIFALLSHRSASQAPPRPIAVSGFCKFRRIRANSAGEYSARTGNAGIRAWQGAGEACQDRNRGKPVLAAARKGIPGPEMREYGLDWGQKSRPKTKTTGNWSWLTTTALGTIPDLQNLWIPLVSLAKCTFYFAKICTFFFAKKCRFKVTCCTITLVAAFDQIQIVA
jgi:hypothetical protein